MTEPAPNAGDVTCIRLLCEEAARAKRKRHGWEAILLWCCAMPLIGATPWLDHDAAMVALGASLALIACSTSHIARLLFSLPSERRNAPNDGTERQEERRQ